MKTQQNEGLKTCAIAFARRWESMDNVGEKNGARYWVRTSDPHRVKVVLYH